jgi:hypothetical protein
MSCAIGRIDTAGPRTPAMIRTDAMSCAIGRIDTAGRRTPTMIRTDAMSCAIGRIDTAGRRTPTIQCLCGLRARRAAPPSRSNARAGSAPSQGIA